MSTGAEDVELHSLIKSCHEYDQDANTFHSPLELDIDDPVVPKPHSATWTKFFVLALACTFSIGSHYAQDCIGPLKDILKTDLSISDSQISLILGSNLVANTIVPVIAGVLVARFGTLKSSLFATGVLFLGQAVNLVALIYDNVPGMILGLCLFGYFLVYHC